MRLQLLTAQECTVCRAFIHEADAPATVIQATLFGVARYGVCIGCNAVVEHPENTDRNYRRRWRRRYWNNALASLGKERSVNGV